MKISILLSLLCLNFSLEAQTLEEANVIFEQRATIARNDQGVITSVSPNIAKIDQAIDAYSILSKTETGARLVTAIERIGRLAYYRGELLGSESPVNQTRGTQLSATDRANVFKKCREATLQLGSKLGDQKNRNIQYVYWYMVCSGLWYSSAFDSFSDTEKARYNRELKNAFNQVVDENTLEIKSELGLDTNYMGGGLQRAFAGIFSNRLAFNININLPKFDKALQLIDAAITAQPDTNQVDGNQMISNHRVRSIILAKPEVGRVDESKTYAREQVKRFDENVADKQLIPGFEAEMFADRDLLNDLSR